MNKKTEIGQIVDLAKAWEEFAQCAIQMMSDLSLSERRFLKRYFSGDFPKSIFKGRESTKWRMQRKLQNPKLYLRVLQVRALTFNLLIEWLERHIIALTAICVPEIVEGSHSGALHSARAKLLETLIKLKEDAEKKRDELVTEIRSVEHKLEQRLDS